MVSSSFRGTPRVKLLCALVASCFAAEGLANPTGPAVAAGAASFNTVGKTLTVTNSPNAIINWKGFSIGAGEVTRFQQQGASSAVLNRVVGQDPSAILGTLSSNGKVFLVNPNGVLFGQGSRIDVAGLVASTLNITDPDFLAGRLNFQAGAVAGSIVNQGEIVSASGGRIYLIAPDVQNHGLISSPSGEIVLAAGKTVSLVDADVPNLKVEVQAGGEALNVGKIIADGGKVGIYAGLINQRGIVRADSVSQDATGTIVFKASDTTILDDGSVTSAAGAKGGEIQVLGNKVGLVGTAKIDASGDGGGGTVLVGGDYQGQNADVQNAWRTYLAPQSSIVADAITAGDGGKVVVWSDDAARAYGSISARGGSQSGNGGFVEVSGKNWLDFGATVNTSALRGATGVLLLDPAAVAITNAVDVGGSFDGGNPNIFGSGLVSSTVTWTTIKNHLTGASGGSNTNVYITTSGSGCSIPGACGIDILASSGDLQSSNTLRLISHEHINVQAGTGISNTGSGALEMYAGWDGVSTPSPNLVNSTGTITINAPINFPAGNVLLRAFSNISSSAAGSITTPNLLASTLNGAVTLNSPTNMVGTLAGEFHDDFQFTNGSSLTIGTVGGVNGISTVGSPGAAPTLQLNVTGNLIVNSPISVSDGGGTDGTTSVTLNASSISVNNTAVTATADVNDSGDGQPASVMLNANTGGILISNSTVSAIGGQGGNGGDAGGSATVGLNAFGGITVNSSTTISATGGAGAPDSISGANGGDANVALHAGGTINTSASTLSATGGAPVNGGAAGVGTATLEVSSSSGNVSPTGDIVLHNVTAGNVNLQQQSLGSARSILRASGTSLITATQVLMEADDPGNVGGGSIGTSAAPIRIQAARLEAHTHEVSPGIFIDSPNAGNLQIGGVSFFLGSAKGVQALGGGDIAVGVNGTLTLQSGSANSPCGVGTGGPICTTSGNVTLRAEDMVIGHSVTGTGTVALAPYSVSRQVNIESSPSGGVLSLAPGEIALVSTPGTLEIGRSDGNATMPVTAFPSSASLNASTVKLFAGNIIFSTSLGATGSEYAHSLEMRATNDVSITDQTLLFANGANLALVADSDASGVGNLAISNSLGVGNDRTILVGTDGTNTATMLLQGRNVTVTGTGGASMTTVLRGTGTQTVTAPGMLSIQGGSIESLNGAQTVNAGTIQVLGGNTFGQLIGGTQNITAGAGGILVRGGTGTGNSASIEHDSSSGTQTINVTGGGSIQVEGGASGTSNDAQIFSNAGQNVAAAGIAVTGGAAGGGVDANNNQLGNFAMIRAASGNQSISVGAGGLALSGGGGAATNNFALISQGDPVNGSAGTSQTISVGGGGTVSLGGGSSAQTNVIGGSANPNNFFRGSYAMIQSNGDSQLISFTSGGALNLTGGTVGSNNVAQILSRFGLQTISGAPAITIAAGDTGGYVDLALNKNEGNFAQIVGNAGQNITAGAITLAGGDAGVGNHAQIFNGSTTVAQSITAADVSLTGGAGGGIDSGSTGSSMSNYASIQSNATQAINAVDVALQGGAGGIENFAVIIAPTQSISLSGDLSLVGGGSAAGAVRGGGARIGGGGGSSPGPTNLTLVVDGDLTMTGGSVAGTAIGSGIVGGQTTSMDIDVGGNVTLNPGTAANSESRIGSPASGIAGGDISITAGGTVALNSNPGLGTFIRTLGNVTINAASITQGADSGISAAGTLTTVSSGSQTLNGLNTVASLDATTGGGSLHFTNSTTLDVLNGATSGGVVDITVNSGDLNIPGTINAGTGGVTLVAPTGTVNGTGSSPDITGGTLNITAGNIIGSGGLHLSVPQINSLVATAGQIDVSSFTTATLLNAQASGSIALNSTAPLTIAGPVVSASGQVTINSPATSFAGNVSLTNYTFGSSTTLQSGTLNLAGTTTIPLGTTVAVQGGTLNASSGTVNVAGTMQTTSGSVSASTVNLNGLFDASGGAVTVGTLNVLSGGTLSGTGTIVGNVNNSAGIVSPGASPGILTVTGNYVQGPSGVLDMQIGGLVAGSDYDQLLVGGTTSLAGTLNTALINGFVPVSGDSFTLIQSTGPISGTFTTTNAPVGSLFNSFYGPTTFEFVAAAAAVLPPPLVVAVNNVIVSTEQLIQPVIEVLEIIPVSAIVSDTTTTAEGQLVPKKTSCQ